MIINRLSVEGFRTIGNKIDINFPENGRIGIFGHNESGKSTIFDAIEFALFGLSIRGIAKEDRITWGGNKLKVVLEFTSGDKKYRIERILSINSHKVKLVQLKDNVPVTDSELTSITPVEEFIEEIIGMDKDSYSKLIYIRQKELDALKDLQKRDREKLINKVIGIDIFDDASSNANLDMKENKNELENIETKIGYLKSSYDSYTDKKEKIKDLEPEIEKLELNLNQIQEHEEELKNKLNDCEWINKYSSKKDILDSKKSEFNSKNSEVTKLKSDKTNLEKFQCIIEKFKPKFDQLKEIKNKFEIKEYELFQEEQKLEEKKLQTPVNITDSSQLPKRRSSSLRIGIILLCLSIFLIAIGIALIFTIIIGIILLVISFVFLNRYRKYDKQIMNNVDNQSTIQLITAHETQISKINQDITNLQNQYGKKSSAEIKNELEKLTSKIFNETGYSNIEELQGVVTNLNSRTGYDLVTNLQEINSLEQGINSLEQELSSLENEKPFGIDLEQSTDKYIQIKEKYENILDKLQTKTEELSGKKATKLQLENDCQDLQQDYEEYPNELESKNKITNQIQLLEFVMQQFRLVSEKIRSRVIPQARHEINQMMPIITAGRYADFKISEDLKFQVYTTQTGGYKERELFSGGDTRSIPYCIKIGIYKKHIGF